MTYCVGLTGLAASGKSTVAQLFAKLGVTRIDADEIAKTLTERGKPALAEIIAHFGPKYLDSDGNLRRKALRDTIFQSSDERHWLEQLLHPLIRKKIEEQIALPTKLYYLVEIPLLYDKALYPYLNRILLLVADPRLELQRLTQRDQQSVAKARTLLQVQQENEIDHSLADDIIINNGSIADLEKIVKRLHQRYSADLQPST